ncbi:MAG: site-specific integrase, partial [Thermoproteota archaeon]
MDPHRHAEKLKKALNNLERNGVSARNAAFLRNFAWFRKSMGISAGRILGDVRCLTIAAKIMGKSFDKADVEDIRKVILTIEEKYTKEWTKQRFKVALKVFYRWLKNCEEDPPETRWIKTTVSRRCQILPEQLITEDEIQRMLSKATNARDRAFLMMLYDAGLRPSEILNLKIKNVNFDEYGAYLIVNGKTGPRRVRLLDSVTALAEWLNDHPQKDNPEAPLWVGMWTKNYLKPWDYAAANKMVKRLAAEAGIKKRVWLYLFRHTSATRRAAKIPEPVMCQHYGWVLGSDMPSTYVHLSGRDVDSALLRLKGVNVEEKGREGLSPKVCPRCREENSPALSFCRRCGAPLDLKVALELDEKKNSEIAELKDMMKELCKLITVIGEAYLNDEDGSIRQRCGHLIKECLPLL